MQSTISLRAPNIGPAPELAVGFVGSVAAVAGLAHDDALSLGQATDRRVWFALEHADPDGAEGEIAVEAHLFDGGIRVDVHDWGLPLELERDRASGGRHSVAALPGLDLSGLIDEASFHALGRDGKLFTIVKHCEHEAAPAVPAGALLTEHDDHEQGQASDDLVVRPFQEGDEEGICRLVYRNHANTYGADFFYVPEKLLERNRSGEVVSTRSHSSTARSSATTRSCASRRTRWPKRARRSSIPIGRGSASSTRWPPRRSRTRAGRG